MYVSMCVPFVRGEGNISRMFYMSKYLYIQLLLLSTSIQDHNYAEYNVAILNIIKFYIVSEIHLSFFSHSIFRFVRNQRIKESITQSMNE